MKIKIKELEISDHGDLKVIVVCITIIVVAAVLVSACVFATNLS